jgi:hypothetical protein
VLSEQWSERLENSMRAAGNELSTQKNHRKAFRQQADSIFRTFVTIGGGNARGDGLGRVRFDFSLSSETH